MNSIALSIIIPTHQRTENVLGLVRTLDQIRSIDMEVLIVSNPPDAKLKRMVEDQKLGVRYFEVDVSGVNRARNVGVAHARGRILLFLDDDCRIDDPGFLKKHLSWHDRFSEVVAVGGSYLLRENASLLSRVYHQKQVNWLESGRRARGRCVHLLGGNLSIKAQALQSRRFCEELIFGGTETELLTRLVSQGESLLYSDDLKVYHDSNFGFIELLLKGFYQGNGLAYIESRLPMPALSLGQFTDRGAVSSEKITRIERVLEASYGFAFQAGRRFGKNSERPISGVTGVWGLVVAEAFRSLSSPGSTGFMNDFLDGCRAALRLYGTHNKPKRS